MEYDQNYGPRGVGKWYQAEAAATGCREARKNRESNVLLFKDIQPNPT